MPYNDITKTNNIPKNNFVLNMAKASSTLDSLTEKICVMTMVTVTNITNASSENNLVAEDIMTNQREKPNVTARALNLGEDNSILNWIKQGN